MQFGINLGYLTRAIPLERAGQILAEAGFQTVDYSGHHEIDDWESVAANELSLLQKSGITVHQTHAPINRYGEHGDNHREYVWRTLRMTEIFGAKYMIAHGDEFDFVNMEYTPERAFQYNYEFYAPIIEEAAKRGIKVAFETVFEDGKRINGAPCPRFTSRAEDLLALIERFNTDTVCCCWDFGHAGISFGDEHADMIRKFGRYIECMHLQDRWHRLDAHLIPFSGTNNWDACMAALGEIGYKGNLTYEFAYGKIPEATCLDFAKYLVKTAEYLASLMKV